MLFFPFNGKLKLLFACAVTSCLLHAAPTVADTTASARADNSSLSRDFSVVPAGNVLYSHFRSLRSTGWIGAPQDGNSTTMTRYEMALEIAKALITVRAQYQADERFISTAKATSLQALRALCVALQSELSRFDVDSKATVEQIDHWLKSSTTAERSLGEPANSVSTIRLPQELTSAPNIRDGDASLTLPLSQRLRVHAAVTSIARATSDPLQVSDDTTTGSMRLSDRSAISFGNAGATFAVNNWLQLRGGVSRQPVANNISEALGNNDSASPEAGERLFSGGVDIQLRPGVVVSGDVSRFQASSGLFSALSDFSGTRYHGGVELSGWESRVALSANLSRLVPEDSLALSMTAAQLNLGVGLTEQVSLKLLYQQLFDAPQPSRSNRVVAGGININF